MPLIFQRERISENVTQQLKIIDAYLQVNTKASIELSPIFEAERMGRIVYITAKNDDKPVGFTLFEITKPLLSMTREAVELASYLKSGFSPHDAELYRYAEKTIKSLGIYRTVLSKPLADYAPMPTMYTRTFQ